MKNQSDKSMKRTSSKTSLMKNFLFLSISILLLFVGITAFSIIELTGYDLFANNLTNSSMPKIMKSLGIHTTTKEFTYLADKLTESNSMIAKKITYKEIEKKINFIKKFDLDFFGQKHLKDKLEKIQQEFKNLDSLVEKKIINQEKIRVKINKLDGLNESFIKTFSNDKSITWNIKYLKNIAISSRLNRVEKMRDLPKLKSIVDQNFYFLYKNVTTKKEQKFVDKLNSVLLDKRGLFQLKEDEFRAKYKINQSRILARSLINNFSDEIKYLSVWENENLVNKVQEASEQLELRIKILFLFFIFCFFYLMGVIFHFRKQIIQRLVKLDNNIYQRLKGGKEILKDDGEDEISYITQSFNFFAAKVEKQKLKLQELALTDGLTNISNRRLFDIKFKDEMRYIKRFNYPSSIFMIDVDNFKLFNDNYGHIAGDHCLKKIASTLEAHLQRDVDFIARYGGEEFICILSNTNIEQSKNVANRLIKAIEDLKIPHKYNEQYSWVTVSMGIKTIFKQECELGSQNIKFADEALYEAKSSGKNRYVHYNATRR